MDPCTGLLLPAQPAINSNNRATFLPTTNIFIYSLVEKLERLYRHEARDRNRSLIVRFIYIKYLKDLFVDEKSDRDSCVQDLYVVPNAYKSIFAI